MSGTKGERRELGRHFIPGAIIVLLVANLWQMSFVHQDVRTVKSYVSVKHTTMITKWPSDGILHEVETHLGERDPSETDSQHADRHRRRFHLMLRLFPKRE